MILRGSTMARSPRGVPFDHHHVSIYFLKVNASDLLYRCSLVLVTSSNNHRRDNEEESPCVVLVGGSAATWRGTSRYSRVLEVVQRYDDKGRCMKVSPPNSDDGRRWTEPCNGMDGTGHYKDVVTKVSPGDFATFDHVLVDMNQVSIYLHT